MPPPNGQVWNIWIRLAHWAVALAFLAAMVTAGRPLELHARAGDIVVLYAALRLALALRGPASARFDPEWLSPRAWLDEVVALARLKPQDYPRHGPVGSAILVVFLASLVAAALSGAVTGVAHYGVASLWGGTPIEDAHVAPAAVRRDAVAADPAVGGTTVISRLPPPPADVDHPSAHVPDGWQQVHASMTWVAVWLLCLHLGWVLVNALVRRENRLMSMFTGLRHAALPPLPKREFPSAASEGRARPVVSDQRSEKDAARAEKDAARAEKEAMRAERDQRREEKARARDEARAAKRSGQADAALTDASVPEGDAPENDGAPSPAGEMRDDTRKTTRRAARDVALAGRDD